MSLKNYIWKICWHAEGGDPKIGLVETFVSSKDNEGATKLVYEENQTDGKSFAVITKVERLGFFYDRSSRIANLQCDQMKVERDRWKNAYGNLYAKLHPNSLLSEESPAPYHGAYPTRGKDCCEYARDCGLACLCDCHASDFDSGKPAPCGNTKRAWLEKQPTIDSKAVSELKKMSEQDRLLAIAEFCRGCGILLRNEDGSTRRCNCERDI